MKKRTYIALLFAIPLLLALCSNATWAQGPPQQGPGWCNDICGTECDQACSPALCVSYDSEWVSRPPSCTCSDITCLLFSDPEVDEDFGKKRKLKKFNLCWDRCLTFCANGCQTSSVEIVDGECQFDCIAIEDNEGGKDPGKHWPTDAECLDACNLGTACPPPMMCLGSEADGAGGCAPECWL